MIASLLLAVPFALPLPLAPRFDGAGTEDNPRPVVLKRHSIAAFALPLPEAPTNLSLLPLPRIGDDDEVSGEREMLPPFDPDGLVDLIRNVVEPAGWEIEPNWRLELRQPGELFVVAPAEVQARIGELLDTLERDLLPSERLEVRLLPGGPATAASGTLLVDRATADKRIAEHGAVHFGRVRLHDRIAVDGRFGETLEFTSGWDVDVADGMSTTTPRRDQWLRGLCLVARATRTDGGTLVDLIVRAAEPAAANESAAIDASALFNLQPSLLPRQALGRIDLPRAGFVSFAGTLLLPEGSDLLLPVAVKTAWGPVEWTLDVRCEQGASKAMATIEPIARAEGEPLRLSIRRPLPSSLGTLEAPRFVRQQAQDRFVSQWFHGSARLGSFAGPDMEQSFASEAVGDLFERDPTAMIAQLSSGHLRTQLPAAESDAVARTLAITSSLDAGATLRGRVKVGNETRAEFAVPLVTGRLCALWAGVDCRLVRGWECEIAKEAACPQPVVEGFLDGVALRFLLTRSSRGELQLDVNAGAELLAAIPQLVDLGDLSGHAVHQVRANVLAIDDRVAFGARGGSVALGGDVTLELDLLPQ
jgi:hypothetical protein